MERVETRSVDPWGPWVALGVMSGWALHLGSLLYAGPDASHPVRMVLHVLLQSYLFTGLFITGHDAMHGSVSRHRRLNGAVGWMACFLFAGLSYARLVKNHAQHHAAPTRDRDPDFSAANQAFWPWFLRFMVRYTTFTQLLIMAVSYNLLAHVVGVEQWRLLLYWVLPAFLGTLQLFYFGTYRPHRPPWEDAPAPHFARSQRLNHPWALLSCYFFGYHEEHHVSPSTPWWRLWRLKQAGVGNDE